MNTGKQIKMWHCTGEQIKTPGVTGRTGVLAAHLDAENTERPQVKYADVTISQ